jgi:hypothetical protein
LKALIASRKTQVPLKRSGLLTGNSVMSAPVMIAKGR